jgi:hypothetical protein
MTRKMILIMLIGLLLLVAAWVTPVYAQMKRTFQIPGEGPGYDLLRMLADDFGKYAGSCEDSLKTFMEVSDKWIAMAEKAKANGDIDEIFFQRYKRLAIVCKLVVIPDKQRILSDLIVNEINKFAGEPLGKDFQFQGIGSVASKLAREILSLKTYLDKG